MDKVAFVVLVPYRYVKGVAEANEVLSNFFKVFEDAKDLQTKKHSVHIIIQPNLESSNNTFFDLHKKIKGKWVRLARVEELDASKGYKYRYSVHKVFVDSDEKFHKINNEKLKAGNTLRWKKKPRDNIFQFTESSEDVYYLRKKLIKKTFFDVSKKIKGVWVRLTRVEELDATPDYQYRYVVHKVFVDSDEQSHKINNEKLKAGNTLNWNRKPRDDVFRFKESSEDELSEPLAKCTPLQPDFVDYKHKWRVEEVYYAGKGETYGSNKVKLAKDVEIKWKQGPVRFRFEKIQDQGKETDKNIMDSEREKWLGRFDRKVDILPLLRWHKKGREVQYGLFRNKLLHHETTIKTLNELGKQSIVYAHIFDPDVVSLRVKVNSEPTLLFTAYADEILKSTRQASGATLSQSTKPYNAIDKQQTQTTGTNSTGEHQQQSITTRELDSSNGDQHQQQDRPSETTATRSICVNSGTQAFDLNELPAVLSSSYCFEDNADNIVINRLFALNTELNCELHFHLPGAGYFSECNTLLLYDASYWNDLQFSLNNNEIIPIVKKLHKTKKVSYIQGAMPTTIPERMKGWKESVTNQIGWNDFRRLEKCPQVVLDPFRWARRIRSAISSSVVSGDGKLNKWLSKLWKLYNPTHSYQEAKTTKSFYNFIQDGYNQQFTDSSASFGDILGHLDRYSSNEDLWRSVIEAAESCRKKCIEHFRSWMNEGSHRHQG